MASIRTKGRGFAARVSINGKPFSKIHRSVEEAQRWVTGIKLGFITGCDHNTPCVTQKKACQRYASEVVIHHKGARQELNRLRQLRCVTASFPALGQ